LTINLHEDGPRTLTLGGSLDSATRIREAIQEAVQALAPLRSSTPPEAYTKFAAAFADGVYELRSGAGGRRSSVVVDTNDPGDAASLLKLGAGNGGIEFTGAAELRPAPGTYLLGIGAAGGATVGVTKGTDGKTPTDDDYRRTFTLLDPLRDVNIVAVPGLGSRAVIDEGGRYCQQRQDCFYVADVVRETDTAAEARAFVTSELKFKTSYAALYFPWVVTVDPSGAPEPKLVPPSGFVAGMFARIDARRGVWKAPAGTEANIGGATGLAAAIADAEQDTLNPLGVNVVRSFPGAGIVIWGARTLATLSDPEYRYVPVRRFAIFLEQSIYNGIQWAVFEPNDEDLWASLRLNIGAFMMTLFRAGAFQGDTPAKAFFVKCDAETNPQDRIDAGIVTVLVGFAPLKPAEFVVIRISQQVAQPGA
jgi:phage tail sheath protein FI